tara:strand:+ start:1331 stop:1639 length:309 start_codon:yes stop_codon:yes gene_type:complete
MMNKNHMIRRGDENFNDTLDYLEKKYFYNGGDPDAEVIVSWNKREIKEDGWISFYGTNSAISSAIKRCRKGIVAVNYTTDGAELYFSSEYVRPLHTVLKVKK